MTEYIKKIISDKLEQMGCKNIDFKQVDENKINVLFDCEEVTSFTSEIQGWKFSGIELSDFSSPEYKIHFEKIQGI